MDIDSLLFSIGYLFGYLGFFALLIYGFYKFIRYLRRGDK